MTRGVDKSISRHYGRTGLSGAFIAALRAAGKSTDSPSIDDLVPVDQFHIRGKESMLKIVKTSKQKAAILQNH
jgi:MPBQ/MSBQ methyltransferase